MRLFIAIQLNEQMKDALLEIQEDLYASGVHGNFTKEANLHVTLAFIGEFPDPELVTDVLEQINFEPFEIALDGMGSFGSLWWAGFAKGDGQVSLARQVRRALDEAGIPYDRKKFRPHVTLVRKPHSPGGTIPPQVLERLPQASMVVDHFSLMRSERGKHGMIYTELWTSS